jgi:hypothetical protein
VSYRVIRNSSVVASTFFLLVHGGHVFTPAVTGQEGARRFEVLRVVGFSASPPLRTIPPIPPQGGPKHEKELRRVSPDTPSAQVDAVVQTSAGPLTSATSGLLLTGVGAGFVGPAGWYPIHVAPPDPIGAVGATQYVQWVNTAFAIFDKATGRVLYGPADGSTLWGADAPCGQTNDGDPTVLYDKAANRWVFTQLSDSSGGYYSCVAVSQTSDALGPYNRYVWQFSRLNDYPRLAAWSDGYYMSFNMFKSISFTSSYLGPQICALERAKMVAGDPSPAAICYQLGTSDSSLVPSDLDGSTAPPAGSPAYFLSLGKNALRLWKFHADFATPGNSTLTGPTSITVADFNKACGGGTCIPQPGTAQQLDSVGDRLMNRLAYRNFGDHESLVVNHSVTASSGNGNGKGSSSPVGLRWYELRNPGGTPVVYQQATFSPDSTYRWMGSIAMDKVGNIAIGYSASSAAVYPEIRYTGRLRDDVLGTLQSEAIMQMSGGSQQRSLSRWGDYSSMSVDPVDYCTFWYTNEYLVYSGTFNWSTRIASFRFPSCS